MSDYTYYVQPQMDDSYATVKQMKAQYEAESSAWEQAKREVWLTAIRVTAEGLIRFYERAAFSRGFTPRTRKGAFTKMKEMQDALNWVDEHE